MENQRITSFFVVIFHKKWRTKLMDMTKMLMNDKNYLYLSGKSRMIDS